MGGGAEVIHANKGEHSFIVRVTDSDLSAMNNYTRLEYSFYDAWIFFTIDTAEVLSHLLTVQGDW